MPRRNQPQPAPPYIMPTNMRSSTAFAFLIAIAVIWYYGRGPLIGFGMLTIVFVGVPWMLYRIARAIGYFLTGRR